MEKKLTKKLTQKEKLELKHHNSEVLPKDEPLVAKETQNLD